MKRFIALFSLMVFLTVFAGCAHHHNMIPPGQIKKQSAPGQMKKH